MTQLAEPHPVALVGCDPIQAAALAEKLRLMGHASRSFASGAQFLAPLGSGQKFSLLLLALWGESGWAGLVAMCKALNLPMLLMMDESQRHLPVDELVSVRHETSCSPAIDFIVWPVNDIELDLRIRALIRHVDAPV